MKNKDIFEEVLKSPELKEVFKLSQEELKQAKIDEISQHQVVEIIRTIIIGHGGHKNAEQIFRIIEKQIINL